jgi:hypothetical protein
MLLDDTPVKYEVVEPTPMEALVLAALTGSRSLLMIVNE